MFKFIVIVLESNNENIPAKFMVPVGYVLWVNVEKFGIGLFF